jgi:hypothetical protein
MTASRRTSVRTRRHRPRPGKEPRGTETRVSFIGDEIDQAIRRIQAQGADLPRIGRLAVRVATVTLRLCKLRIRASIDCGNWGIKG